MSLDNHIDEMSSHFGGSIERFQLYMIDEVMDLQRQGLTSLQISNVLQQINMEHYLLNE